MSCHCEFRHSPNTNRTDFCMSSSFSTTDSLLIVMCKLCSYYHIFLKLAFLPQVNVSSFREAQRFSDYNWSDQCFIGGISVSGVCWCMQPNIFREFLYKAVAVWLPPFRYPFSAVSVFSGMKVWFMLVAGFQHTWPNIWNLKKIINIETG